MRTLLVLATVVLVGCGGQPLPTYNQLANYPLDCKKKTEQIRDLREIMRLKYFGPDPEFFNKTDKAYYDLLKEHIWWFSYNCEQ